MPSSFSCVRLVHTDSYNGDACPSCTEQFQKRYHGSTHIEGKSATALLPTTEIAELFQVSRSTVSQWALDGRLPAERYGAHWWCRMGDVHLMHQSWVRPKGGGMHRPFFLLEDEFSIQLLLLLENWESATPNELAEKVDLNPGNIRRKLNLLETADLATRLDDGQWRLTEAWGDFVQSIPQLQYDRVYEELGLEPLQRSS